MAQKSSPPPLFEGASPETLSLSLSTHAADQQYAALATLRMGACTSSYDRAQT
jgi:hypothetical protein